MHIKTKEKVKMLDIISIVLLMLVTSLLIVTGQFWFAMGSFVICSLYIARMFVK